MDYQTENKVSDWGMCIRDRFYPLQQFQTTYPFAEKYYPDFLQIHLSPHPNMAPALLHKQPALAPEYCHLMHKTVSYTPLDVYKRQIISPTLDSSFLAVRPPASGVTDSHGVTGGVYKARERIHRDMLIRDY